MAEKAFLERRLRELTAKGKLIEAGWIGLRLMAVPLDAEPIQLEEMRNAFFAGAAHLLHSLMFIMDPGLEETADDLKRVDLIRDELDRFLKDYEFRNFVKPKGSA